MNSKSVCLPILALGLAMMFCTKPASAQPAQGTPAATPPAAQSATVTRAYDVRDLLLLVQDYPISGALVPPTQLGEATSEQTPNRIPTAPNSPAPAPSPLDQLEKILTDTIDASSWKANGGTFGSISSLNGQLLITQTAENQSAITSLLAELRKGRAVMVRIRADWVLLPPGQIDQLLKAGPTDISPLPEISRDALQKLSANTSHYSGQISCFSGQTVYLASGQALTTIMAATPVVAQQAIAYQQMPEIAQYGLSLQVMPAVSSDSATLDLLSVASEAANVRPPATTQMAGVDRVDAVVQHFHTTVQVPLNKPVLIGGMTLEPTSRDTTGNQLYLIVEADAKP
jgi:hypothetical protein